MKNILLSIAVAFFVAGCAAPVDQTGNDLRAWASVAKEDAKAGRMKWSDYYKGMYERLTATKYDDTPFLMEIASTLIDASLAYETGSMDKNQFESLQRQAEIAVSRNTQQLTQAQRAQQQAAWSNTLQNLAAQQRNTTQFYQNQLNKRQTCDTRWTGTQWQTVCR